MKIDQNVTFLKTAAGTPAPARNSAAAPAMAAAEAGQTLSPTALLPSTNGDFDAAKVAQIRESISAGRYQVNVENIADGLLASVRDLLSDRAP
jgi:negative regulator of flagellin synthesis FlgM